MYVFWIPNIVMQAELGCELTSGLKKIHECMMWFNDINSCDQDYSIYVISALYMLINYWDDC